MKKILFLFVIITVIVVGCDNQEDVLNIATDGSKQVEKNESIAEEKVNKQYKEFTYLDGLSEEKKYNYEKFLYNSDINQLNGFTPEEMVLVYFDLISTGNRHNIYKIVYDDGSLPNEKEFVKEYDEYLSLRDNDMIFKYRYYDTIYIDADNSTKSSAVVVIKASMGIHSISTAFSLKKQDGIWKKGIQHLLDE